MNQRVLRAIEAFNTNQKRLDFFRQCQPAKRVGPFLEQFETLPKQELAPPRFPRLGTPFGGWDPPRSSPRQDAQREQDVQHGQKEAFNQAGPEKTWNSALGLDNRQLKGKTFQEIRQLVDAANSRKRTAETFSEEAEVETSLKCRSVIPSATSTRKKRRYSKDRVNYEVFEEFDPPFDEADFGSDDGYNFNLSDLEADSDTLGSSIGTSATGQHIKRAQWRNFNGEIELIPVTPQKRKSSTFLQSPSKRRRDDNATGPLSFATLILQRAQLAQIRKEREERDRRIAEEIAEEKAAHATIRSGLESFQSEPALLAERASNGKRKREESFPSTIAAYEPPAKKIRGTGKENQTPVSAQNSAGLVSPISAFSTAHQKNTKGNLHLKVKSKKAGKGKRKAVVYPPHPDAISYIEFLTEVEKERILDIMPSLGSILGTSRRESTISHPHTNTNGVSNAKGTKRAKRAKLTAEQAEKERALERNIDQVVLGDIMFKTWYPSWYPKEIIGDKALNGDYKSVGITVPTLYVCKKCFRYSKEVVPWFKHCKLCTQDEPPGKLIYSHGGEGNSPWSVWVVDGEVETVRLSVAHLPHFKNDKLTRRRYSAKISPSSRNSFSTPNPSSLTFTALITTFLCTLPLSPARNKS